MGFQLLTVHRAQEQFSDAQQLGDIWLAGVEPAMPVLAGDQAVIGANRMALLSASRESQPATKMTAKCLCLAVCTMS